MKILVATDAHIYETPDGKHWTPAIYSYSFWKRYLNVFDNVRIVARTKKVDSVSDKALLVDGPGIEIFPIPFYQGPKQLVKVFFSIHKALNNVDEGCDVALFRMPSQTAQMTYSHVKGKLPIGGEIVYDPTDDLKRKDTSIIIRVLNMIISKRLKIFCKKANGVAYVTENSIQRNYPSTARLKGESEYYFETYYSTITMNEAAFAEPKKYANKKTLVLGFSNVSMNTDRKGERVLLGAVKKAREQGFDVSAVLIGDGTMRKSFEELAVELGIENDIRFTGRLASAEEVRQELLSVDMFVFPSQAEGLHRGILEAMAVGLPVLSTPVGGIPEIINKKYLFDPKDVNGFSDMICYLIQHPEELEEMSIQNYNKALEYKNSILQNRRDIFYKKLLNIRRVS